MGIVPRRQVAKTDKQNAFADAHQSLDDPAEPRQRSVVLGLWCVVLRFIISVSSDCIKASFIVPG